jgi:hypothetical protein
MFSFSCHRVQGSSTLVLVISSKFVMGDGSSGELAWKGKSVPLEKEVV